VSPIWFAVGASLLGGGAMGAFINRWLQRQQDRKQPIQYKQETTHIFRKNQEFKNLQARLLVKDRTVTNEPETAVENLSLVQYSITNAGNKDFPSFKFLIKLGGSNKYIDLDISEPTDLHDITLGYSKVVDETFFNKPEFTLTPFNRGDTYTIRIFFTYETEPGAINIQTAEPVELIDMSDIRIIDGPLYRAPPTKWERLLVQIITIILILSFLVIIFGLLSHVEFIKNDLF
jgi:hypothetical protein